MSGSIKLTPEQAKARQESSVQRIIERQESLAMREQMRRDAQREQSYMLAYAGILIFMVGVLVGTFL